MQGAPGLQPLWTVTQVWVGFPVIEIARVIAVPCAEHLINIPGRNPNKTSLSHQLEHWCSCEFINLVSRVLPFEGEQTCLCCVSLGKVSHTTFCTLTGR